MVETCNFNKHQKLSSIEGFGLYIYDKKHSGLSALNIIIIIIDSSLPRKH
jgi:hypothetical protein